MVSLVTTAQVLLVLFAFSAFRWWDTGHGPLLVYKLGLLGQLLQLAMMAAVSGLGIYALVWAWHSGTWYQIFGGMVLGGALNEGLWRPMAVKLVFASPFGPPICIAGLVAINWWVRQT
jgi:hypothetical protein